MDVLFENDFRYNYSNMLQFARFVQRKTLLIIAGLALIAGVYFLCDASVLTGVLFLVCAVMAVALFIFTPVSNVKKQLHYMSHVGKYPITITCKFTVDNIVSTNSSSKAKTVVEYDEIRLIKELKDIYVVKCEGQGIYITLEKDGFTIGNADDFLVFIKSKIQSNVK